MLDEKSKRSFSGIASRVSSVGKVSNNSVHIGIYSIFAFCVGFFSFEVEKTKERGTESVR